jgi:hypothetical protein
MVLQLLLLVPVFLPVLPLQLIRPSLGSGHASLLVLVLVPPLALAVERRST